jgi:O-acetyl-ADP-ribose deacetylase (regulator of RNase III)
MVKIINGNLLDFPNDINVIAHSCNCRMIMGGGIAKQIKDRYPQAYQADIDYISDEYDHNGQFKHPLGTFSKAEVGDDKYIYNMYTQATIGTGERQVNYEKFWQALKKVEEELFEINVTKHEYNPSPPPILGLPWGISCGLAGGNWGIIFAMISDIFLDSQIKCYIVKYDE